MFYSPLLPSKGSFNCYVIPSLIAYILQKESHHLFSFYIPFSRKSEVVSQLKIPRSAICAVSFFLPNFTPKHPPNGLDAQRSIFLGFCSRSFFPPITVIAHQLTIFFVTCDQCEVMDALHRVRGKHCFLSECPELGQSQFCSVLSIPRSVSAQ